MMPPRDIPVCCSSQNNGQSCDHQWRADVITRLDEQSRRLEKIEEAIFGNGSLGLKTMLYIVIVVVALGVPANILTKLLL